VFTLGLALATLPSAHAKTFECDAGNVDCLITAIETANANGQTNTIRLAAGTYALTESYGGTLYDDNGLPVITSTLTIRGAGAATTIIKRDAPFDFPFFFRLLQVAATGSLTLDRLTLREGIVTSAGGGIYNAGTLTLTDCALITNVAYHAHGGGIYNTGTVTLTDCFLTTNSSYGGSGIYNTGTATLINCSLTANLARSSGGGGIFNAGTLTLTNSTLADNTADENISDGGGIFNAGTLTLTNSTLADNTAYSGGGIANAGTLTLTNSTLADNTATVGGGLVNRGTMTLQNAILALNTSASTSSPSDDCFGVVTSRGNNLLGDTTGCSITLQSSDLTGNPGLDAFTDDGTPGNGHFPLLETSRAIDAGNDAACPRADQLGQPRVDIPQVGTSHCDIGAIEFPPQDNRPSIAAQATP
jgi:hypothetical protein